MANYFRQFDNLKSWIDYSEADQPTDGNDRESTLDRKWFTGVSTKKEAYHFFRVGHPAGLKRMQDVLDGLNENIQMSTMHDEFNVDVAGCAPNVEAYVQGIPEDMFVISQIEATCPPSFLTVQFELAYASQITIEQASLAGAIVFAAMEALKLQGCNVSTLVTHTVSRSGNTWQSAVPVPNNLDLDTLAFIFTHPAMLRVLVFSIMEHETPDIRAQFGFYRGGGYSRPAIIKNPKADCVITMATLCNQLFYGGTTTIQKAQELLKNLVDTRFGTIASTK